jgi:hypothetical protein
MVTFDRYSGAVDIRGSEDGLLRVLTGTEIIGVIGGDVDLRMRGARNDFEHRDGDARKTDPHTSPFKYRGRGEIVLRRSFPLPDHPELSMGASSIWHAPM